MEKAVAVERSEWGVKAEASRRITDEETPVSFSYEELQHIMFLAECQLEEIKGDKLVSNELRAMVRRIPRKVMRAMDKRYNKILKGLRVKGVANV